MPTLPTDDQFFVGARLRHLREDRGLKQAELAARLDISPSYLNQIEHDRRPLTVAVLMRLTEAFGIDPQFFSTQDTTRLIAELREALADEVVGVPVSQSELADIAIAHPSVARALIALRRSHRDAVENASAMFATQEAGSSGYVAMPYEQVRDFFYDRQNYVDPLDRAAEDLSAELDVEPAPLRAALARRLHDQHGVRVAYQPPEASAGELRRYDPEARVLRVARQLRPGQQAFQMGLQLALLEHSALINQIIKDSQVSSEASALARFGLAQYFAAATLMPYAAFQSAAEESRYDIERLQEQFDVGFEAICHRLSTLQRSGLRGVPFSFVRVDRAGNVSKRQSATGFHFSRSGGTCPLWTVYEAFTTPGRIVRQIAQLPDGRTYFWVARTVLRKRRGYDEPSKTFALALGCELRHAHRLIYATGLDLSDKTLATPMGLGCRTCERTGCPQRAFPVVDRKLEIDENRTTFAAYEPL